MNAVNVHPGEALQEFLEDYNMSQSQLARELRVPVRRINTIVRGERSLTADTAVRLARYFNNRADFWLGLQELFDINETEKKLSDELQKIHPITV
jgi:addiction module HigA family antidote